MNISRSIAVTALAAGVTISGLLSVPSTAQANPGSDAAIGAAVGAIVGDLLLDSHRQQYYYVRGHRRYYVDQATAARWRERHRHHEQNRRREWRERH